MKMRVLFLCLLTVVLPITASAIELPPLPYAEDALEPHVSERTLEFHYGKHHQGYVNNLNKLIDDTPLAGRTLEDIVLETAGDPDQTAVFNNAAQVWNHTFFWNSMTREGGGEPEGRMLDLIEESFGDYETFKSAFIDAATGQFGSGWAWLVLEEGSLKIVATSNADTPLAHGQRPLLTCDVWEHAYYLDYQNRRAEFVEIFLDHLVNWSFAAEQLQ